MDATPDISPKRSKRRRQSSVPTIHGTTNETPEAASPGELGSMRRGINTGSSSFIGSGSGIYFVRTVQKAFARNRPSNAHEAGGINGDFVPGEDDRIQSQHPSGSLWNSDEVDFAKPPSELVSFDDLVAWSKSYFEIWHPPFPFLHAPSFLDLLEKVSIGGIGSLNFVETMTLRAILSISVADRRQTPKSDASRVPSNLVFGTIEDAIACLSPVMTQPSNLATLQALICTNVFLVSMLRLNAASRMGGVIVRMAYHLGLHRCPSRYKQFSATESDIRRRVFWTIYSLERYLSQSLGLPLDLKDEDIDVCYPDNELHDPAGSIDHNAHASRLLFPAFLARHGRIKGLILELRHISINRRTANPDEVSKVEAEISKWWNEAQDLLEPHCFQDESSFPITPLRDSHKLLLVIQKHESTILLNRPVITTGQNASPFAAAMQNCIGASKQIISRVYQHLQDGMKDAGSQNGKISAPLFWPGFTWCVWMSGLILLYAASEGHYSIQTAQREAERCIKILETISLRGSFWPSACATALKDLQKALPDTAPNSATDLAPTHPIMGTPTSQSEYNPISARTHCPTRHANNQRAEKKEGNTQGQQPTVAGTSDFDNWQGLDRAGILDGISSVERDPAYQQSFDDFSDIFQLMDASYQWYEPYDASRY